MNDKSRNKGKREGDEQTHKDMLDLCRQSFSNMCHALACYYVKFLHRKERKRKRHSAKGGEGLFFTQSTSI